MVLFCFLELIVQQSFFWCSFEAWRCCRCYCYGASCVCVSGLCGRYCELQGDRQFAAEGAAVLPKALLACAFYRSSLPLRLLLLLLLCCCCCLGAFDAGCCGGSAAAAVAAAFMAVPAGNLRCSRMCCLRVAAAVAVASPHFSVATDLAV